MTMQAPSVVWFRSDLRLADNPALTAAAARGPVVPLYVLDDADLADNVAGWQWVAGCGADAAPFFRVFNPILQGEKFDPGGDYVRRWVPELARLPNACIHQPWRAGERVLAAAGVCLGENYPVPIVDHAEARHRALAAYETSK
jgi:deoxyribodipyrimidine photo-lyase